MTKLESIKFDAENRTMFAMLDRNHIAARAREFGIQEREYRRWVRQLERRRRAEVCQAAAVVLFFGSGLCAAFGAWCFWSGAGPLAVLGALGAAAVAAVVGFWCDGWSRE